MAEPKSYEVILNEETLEILDRIANRVTRERIARKIDEIGQNPAIGKPLRGDFTGYRSVRAGAQRYRIIYRIENDRLIVYVVWLGLRKAGDRNDVYATFAKFLKNKRVS